MFVDLAQSFLATHILATRLGNISLLVGDLADILQGWGSLCVEVPDYYLPTFFIR